MERTTQILSLTTSLVLAGANFGASHLTLPILYTRPPSISAPIFSELYYRGAYSLVPLGIFSSSCSFLSAYLIPSQRKLWILAGVATIAQTPWTVLVMAKTNARLNEIAVSKEAMVKASSEEVVDLLRGWTWMNVVRGGLALVGGVIGLLAVSKVNEGLVLKA